jgi:PBP1b-binding outer membrane lipoprotein LpoB
MIRSTALAASLALAAGVIGCGESTPKEVTEENSLVTMDIDMQNFQKAATDVTQQMITAPRVQQELARIAAEKGGKNPYIVITRIVNNSGQKVNMYDFLVAPIEQVFINNGKLDFMSMDAESRDIAAAQGFMSGQQAQIPDLTMYGTVSKLSTYAGSTDQNIYKFDVRLANTKTNTTIFSGSSMTRPKQQTRAGVGF